MTLTQGTFLTILAIVLPVATAFAGFRFSTKAAREQARAEARKVDALAYDRAKEIYESGITALRNELADARADREQARAERDSMRDEREQLRAERDRMKQLNDRYEGEIARLVETNGALEQANMALLDEVANLRGS